MTTKELPAERVLTFERRGRRFCLALAAVSSIIEDQPMTTVPLAPPGIAGLMLQGGRLWTVLEFDQMFGGHATAVTGAQPHIILLAPPFAHLGLRVTNRPDLHRTASSEQLLDIEALVQTLEFEIAHGGGAS